MKKRVLSVLLMLIILIKGFDPVMAELEDVGEISVQDSTESELEHISEEIVVEEDPEIENTPDKTEAEEQEFDTYSDESEPVDEEIDFDEPEEDLELTEESIEEEEILVDGEQDTFIEQEIGEETTFEESELIEEDITEETESGETEEGIVLETENELGEYDLNKEDPDWVGATSGTCGTNVRWNLNNGILTIFGSGEMDNYRFYDNTNSLMAPWYSSSNNINKIVIENGVTSIGMYAFFFF